MSAVAVSDYVSIFKLLRNRNFSVETESLDRHSAETALIRAARDGRAEVAARLVDALSADVDHQSSVTGETPLSAAASVAADAVVALLCARGAAVHVPDGLGRTPLRRACECNAAMTARTLLAHGAVVTPDAFVVACADPVPAMFRELVAPSLPTMKHRVLKMVLADGHAALTKLLLEGHGAVAYELLEALPNPLLGLTDTQGRTLLHRLAEAGEWRSVEWLVKAGCELDAVAPADGGGGGGQSAIMIAAHNGHHKIVSHLLVKGADTRGAIETARAAGHESIAIMLEAYTSQAAWRMRLEADAARL